MTTLKPPPTRPGPPPARSGPSSALVPATPRTLTVAKAAPLVVRLVEYAVEGFGKTTLGMHAPDPVLFQARGELGYQTLLNAGRAPEIPAPVIDSWIDLLSWLDVLIDDQQGRKTLVFDALGGFERLCHEHVCRTYFENDWGDSGFMSYHKGYDVSVGEWLKLLQRLDRLTALGLSVVFLGHARVKPFKNPLGADFDRYECDVHAKTWAVTAKWCDAVLFGNFYSVIETKKRDKGNVADKKGKGIGGTSRVLYTERRDAFDAKNRFGMTKELWLPEDPAQVWPTVWTEITRNKQEAQQ